MNEKDQDKFINSPWAFFTLVLIISIIFGLPVVLSTSHPYSFPNLLFLIIAAGSPAITGIILISYTKGTAGLKELGKKIIEVKRIGLKWYMLIFLYFPATVGFAIFLDYLISGNVPKFESLNELIAAPVLIIPFIILILIFGPIPEEIGWRGYGLDRCQAKWNALNASLVLGTFWAFWHLPLFYIEGTYQYELGVWSVYFWLFCIDIIASTIIITWVYNNNHDSTLSAILLHFMINFTGQLLDPTGFALLYKTIFNIFFAILIVYFWGPNTLTKENEGTLV